MRVTRFVVIAAVLVAGCLASPVEPLPLQITLSAPATVAVGDTLDFIAEVQGDKLLGVSIDYADGSSDTYSLFGARTAHITFRHAYQTTGTYDASATATDATGSKGATVQVKAN